MKKYLECSRSAWYSLLFVLPLWLLYEFLAVAINLDSQVKVVNGADAILRTALSIVGVQGRLAGMLCLAVLASIWVWRADAGHRKQGVYPGYFLGMLAESGVYALLFGGVVVRLMQLFFPGFLVNLQAGATHGLGVGAEFMTSLGAGVYEELLFRVLIMGGLTLAGTRLLKMKPGVSLLVAMVVSSLVFSGFHYVGSMADQFNVASFGFRFTAGMVLAVIYRVRGFGIAVYTHALYDVLYFVQGGR